MLPSIGVECHSTMKSKRVHQPSREGDKAVGGGSVKTVKCQLSIQDTAGRVSGVGKRQERGHGVGGRGSPTALERTRSKFLPNIQTQRGEAGGKETHEGRTGGEWAQ